MTAELWQRVRQILDRVLEADPRDRPSVLDEACGGDPDLRREVESLLEAEGAAAGFIEEPVLSLRPQGDETEAAVTPHRLEALEKARRGEP